MGKMSTTDRAMLKVAYLLSSITGEIGKAESEAFKTLCFSNNGMQPGVQDANDFLISVITESEKLQKLKKFYSEDEFICAFVASIEKECKILKADPVLARKSFAVWVGLCMADGKYTDLEKKIIKTLQNVFAPSFQFDLISPIYCLTPVWFVYNHFAGGYKTFVKKEEVNISDEFLAELEEDCKMLNDLKMQIDSTADAAQKASLQNSFNYIEDSLKELIKNGLN